MVDVEMLIDEIKNINVRISRETETDSGEMNADMMRDIIIRKIRRFFDGANQ